MRIYLDEEPYRRTLPSQTGRNQSGQMLLDAEGKVPLFERGRWPSFWIGSEERLEAPFVLAFRRRFTLTGATSVRFHVTADERYELFLDGRRVARGPERGDPNQWLFESFEWSLPPGEHVMVAVVFALGFAAPRAQMSLAPGLLLSPDAEEHLDLLGTGVAGWEVKRVAGHTFVEPFSHDFYSIGYSQEIDGRRYPWGVETGAGEDWKPVKRLLSGGNRSSLNRYPSTHLLAPAKLPELGRGDFRGGEVRFVGTFGRTENPAAIPVNFGKQIAGEAEGWGRLLLGARTVSIPKGSRRRVIVDLEDYVCAYPAIRVSGGSGASIRLHWAESLFCGTEGVRKGNRNEVAGKYFLGAGDTFLPDGGQRRVFEPLLWRAGRYLEMVVVTGEEDLTIEEIRLQKTGYPLACDFSFEASDARLASILSPALKTLGASAHDSFIDGPYYEQMMWAGDGVQTMLSHFAVTADDRLARKSLELFDSSRLPQGLTRARWPARDTMIIPPYALYWVQMVYEFAFWRDDLAFVRARMPGVRAVLDAFLGFLNRDGLVEISVGWNFVDWSPEWPNGIPPGADGGVCAVINWQFVRVLGMIAELEETVGEVELAGRAGRLAAELAQRVSAAFWDDGRRLFADEIGGGRFSEHAQCFAVLSGRLTSDQRKRIALIEDVSLTRATLSFAHFLFDTYRELGCVEAMFPRLETWYDLPKLGLITLPEGPEPSRSDCHAWGAHPLYHFFASILGIRPSSPGFRTVHVAPQLGPLRFAKGRMPHPLGEIAADLRRDGNELIARIRLPVGLSGTFAYGGSRRLLVEGDQTIAVEV